MKGFCHVCNSPNVKKVTITETIGGDKSTAVTKDFMLCNEHMETYTADIDHLELLFD